MKRRSFGFVFESRQFLCNADSVVILDIAGDNVDRVLKLNKSG